MKKRLRFAGALLLAFLLTACGGRPNETPPGVLGSGGSEDNSLSEDSSLQNRSSTPETSPSSEDSMPLEPLEGADAKEQLYIQLQMEGGNAILIRLNDSAAAKSLYEQLPLTVQMEDYGGIEKIFYPPAELDTTDAPLAQGPAGILAYYQPWGDVALFYGDCGGASGLYELGETISGTDHIANLAGEVRIEKAMRESGPGAAGLV